MYSKKLLTIPVLWFDAKGYGPSELEVDVVSNQEDDPEFKSIPPAIGLRFMARSDAGLVMANVEPILGGGPFMHHEQVEQLYRALGEWLTERKREVALDELAQETQDAGGYPELEEAPTP